MKTVVNSFELGATEEYTTNEETDRKEEHERSPDDISYHPVDE